MSERPVLLVIDDELAITTMITLTLENEGYTVFSAHNAAEGLAAIHDHQPDLVILDWMMPGTTGLELLRRLRRNEATQTLPVILLTAKTSEDSQVTGLDAGADDYIAKPFSTRELNARIRTQLRRQTQGKALNPLLAGPLAIDSHSHRVTIGSMNIELAPTEFRLLQFFMQNQERVFSREQLLNHVWGTNTYIDERTVDVHIRRLRKTISIENCDHYIQTVRSAGYRFSTNKGQPI